MQALQGVFFPKRELAKEVDKVKALSPTQYYISTTVGLTPANKEEIKQMFHPYILSTEDILEEMI